MWDLDIFQCALHAQHLLDLVREQQIVNDPLDESKIGVS